jgi:hypothetical protein
MLRKPQCLIEMSLRRLAGLRKLVFDTTEIGTVKVTLQLQPLV